VKNLIPSYILVKSKENKFKGQFKATTMFIDISGFTAMTQELMKNGKEGAEILSEIINDIYTPSIKAVYDYNGFITTFVLMLSLVFAALFACLLIYHRILFCSLFFFLKQKQGFYPGNL